MCVYVCVPGKGRARFVEDAKNREIRKMYVTPHRRSGSISLRHKVESVVPSVLKLRAPIRSNKVSAKFVTVRNCSLARSLAR